MTNQINFALGFCVAGALALAAGPTITEYLRKAFIEAPVAIEDLSRHGPEQDHTNVPLWTAAQVRPPQSSVAYIAVYPYEGSSASDVL